MSLYWLLLLLPLAMLTGMARFLIVTRTRTTPMYTIEYSHSHVTVVNAILNVPIALFPIYNGDHKEARGYADLFIRATGTCYTPASDQGAPMTVQQLIALLSIMPNQSAEVVMPSRHGGYTTIDHIYVHLENFDGTVRAYRLAGA